VEIAALSHRYPKEGRKKIGGTERNGKGKKGKERGKGRGSVLIYTKACERGGGKRIDKHDTKSKRKRFLKYAAI